MELKRTILRENVIAARLNCAWRVKGLKVSGVHRVYFIVFFILSALFITELSVHAITVSEYFADLYNRNQTIYAVKRHPEYLEFCNDFALNKDDFKNQNLFFKMYFIHDLFTGTECVDFVAGGVLQIPYAWHWIDPNPRHSITFRSEGIALVKVQPPTEFSRYKSYADIDRIPSFYIKDLFSSSPRYHHPDIGDFYGFGWCSEREMAYAALLNVLGYQCKIKQEGIHVKTEVWAEFVEKSGASVTITIQVDNSMDYIEWNAVGKTMIFANWKNDIGSGKQIQWYNKIAFSNKEQQWLTTTQVEKDQYLWIENRLKQWLIKAR